MKEKKQTLLSLNRQLKKEEESKLDWMETSVELNDEVKDVLGELYIQKQVSKLLMLTMVLLILNFIVMMGVLR